MLIPRNLKAISLATLSVINESYFITVPLELVCVSLSNFPVLELQLDRRPLDRSIVVRAELPGTRANVNPFKNVIILKR